MYFTLMWSDSGKGHCWSDHEQIWFVSVELSYSLVFCRRSLLKSGRGFCNGPDIAAYECVWSQSAMCAAVAWVCERSCCVTFYWPRDRMREPRFTVRLSQGLILLLQSMLVSSIYMFIYLIYIAGLNFFVQILPSDNIFWPEGILDNFSCFR